MRRPNIILLALRKRHNMSQKKLAALLNLNIDRIKIIENDEKPLKIKELNLYAKVFQVTPLFWEEVKLFWKLERLIKRTEK